MPAKKDKKEKEAPKPKEPEPSEDEEESDSDEPVPAPKAKQSLFALMADDSDEEEEEEEEQIKETKKKKQPKGESKAAESKAGGGDELQAMFGEKKKKKSKETEKKDGEKDGEKADGEEKKKKKKEKKPVPIVCEVVEVKPVPRKDTLRLCKVRTAEGADPVSVVTSAANIAVGKRFVVALPGVTTPSGVEVKPAKVGGVDSSGMFCGPNEMNWSTDVLQATHAVMLSETTALGSPAPSYDEAVQLHQERLKAEKEKAEKEKAEAEAKAKKGGKKKGAAAKEDEEDLDALFAEFGVQAVAVDTSAKAGNKKGKKGKQQEKKQEENEDFDAALKEFQEPAKPEPAKPEAKPEPAEPAKPEPVAEPAKAEPTKVEQEAAKPAKVEEKAEEVVDAKTLANRKKREKKKAKQGGGAADDDDFDAVLSEFKEPPPAEEAPKLVEEAPPPVEEAPKPAAEPPKPAEKEEKAPEPAAAAKAEEEDDQEDAADSKVDAKTLANRRKKEKKKAKNNPIGGEGLWGGEAAPASEDKGAVGAAASSSSAAPPPNEEPAAKAEPAPKGKAKPDPKAKGGKKESAIVRAARERMEAERKLEEERLAFEAEQRRIIAEEEARIKAEEERIEAEKKRKRDARNAKIQRMKEEGTYQTKKEKENAKRAAFMRKQFGFDMSDDEGEEGEKKPTSAKVTSKDKKDMIRKKQRKQQQQAEDAEDTAEATAEEPPPVAKEEPKPEDKAEEGDDDDDWEKNADKEGEDEEEEATAGAKAKAGADDASESGDEGSDDESKGSDSEGSSSSSGSSSSDLGYRSPIIVIMGHVDTGKTKLLDKIRRTNVQEGEAGGITQQIGATFFPHVALFEQTKKVDPDFDIEVPGIMIIDTPGHESFNNLRARGSSLCDMAILVIDIMHGLEPQTVESLNMLKKRRCPFIIALNKIDCCYQWNSEGYTGVRDALTRQEKFVQEEFEQRLGNVMLQLNEHGLNVSLYWENEDPRSVVSICPTSALTGEGVPDLLFNLLNLTQTLMGDRLEVKEDLECTVIEVKNIEGLGTTIDVVLVNGTLKEGDQIVLAGMGGPIVTTIRALLTPKPMKEMRVKGEYIHHPKISMSMGVKICAPGLEEAVAGTELLIVGPDDDVEELKEEVVEGFESVLNDFEKQPEGVYVKASTLGALEALLNFLGDMKIPVFDVGIGEVHKKDVKKAAIMKEKKKAEYAVILCFDVKVNNEAKLQAAHDDVQIMTADIIYHLFDKFTAYMKKVQESKKTESRQEAVFPVILQIDKQHVYHRNNPIVFGCNVVGGQLRIGTPLCVPEKDSLTIGHVGSIERDHKAIQVAKRGDAVCVKVEQNTAQTSITYGRHFDYNQQIYSHITRQSIDTLKENFKDEMQKADWELIIAMKKVFNIS